MRRFEAAAGRCWASALGAQLMARAWGGRCWRLPEAEVGFTPAARHRRRRAATGCLGGLGPEAASDAVHSDSFDLPDGAELLMTGEACTNQAFRIGALAYGLQFHCEGPRSISCASGSWPTRSPPRRRRPASSTASMPQIRRHHLAARHWAEALAERWLRPGRRDPRAGARAA